MTNQSNAVHTISGVQTARQEALEYLPPNTPALPLEPPAYSSLGSPDGLAMESPPSYESLYPHKEVISDIPPV